MSPTYVGQEFNDASERRLGFGQFALVFKDDGKRHRCLRIGWMLNQYLTANFFRFSKASSLIVYRGFVQCSLEPGGIRRRRNHDGAFLGWRSGLCE